MREVRDSSLTEIHSLTRISEVPNSKEDKSRKTFFIHIIFLVFCVHVGRDSSVGVATPYGLDGLRIEFRWLRDRPHLSRPALGPNRRPLQWGPGFPAEVKAAPRGLYDMLLGKVYLFLFVLGFILKWKEICFIVWFILLH